MFTDYFFPEIGGIQDSIATISRSLGQRGHVVDIFAPCYGRRDYRRVGWAALAAPARPDVIRVHSCFGICPEALANGQIAAALSGR
jgi:hypothetical protein